MGYYDVAQICLNGHIINGSSSRSPEFNQKFCNLCGSETITRCTKCNMTINGTYYFEDLFPPSSLDKSPNYCQHCGEPYPWTKNSLEATEELLAIEDCLTEEELSYLRENMNSLLVDTPKSKVVATKFKLALGKITSATGSAIKDIMVDIASESVKKIIFPE